MASYFAYINSTTGVVPSLAHLTFYKALSLSSDQQ